MIVSLKIQQTLSVRLLRAPFNELSEKQKDWLWGLTLGKCLSGGKLIVLGKWLVV